MPIASIEGGDLSKVWEIKTLGKERDAEARKMLEMAAKQVQPIMRKRKWRVQLLSEFCPRNPSLLGLNIDGGREVRVRLRRHGHESEFYPYEDVLGTLLHELTHNAHGPHDASFYKLLDTITKECEELMAKGITGSGQGFDGQGKRLGGYFHNPPPTNLRRAAAAAAEKRAVARGLMPGGPHVLGGDSEIMRALSPLQAAAMAAERRLRDDLWCAAPTTIGGNGIEKAREREEVTGPQLSDRKSAGGWDPSNGDSKENFQQAINGQDLPDGRASGKGVGNVGGTFVRHENGVGPIQSAVLASAENRARVPAQARAPELSWAESSGGLHGRSRGVEGDSASTSEAAKWACSRCTLLNPSLALVCAACASMRVADIDVTPKLKTWTCKFCTLENFELLDNCEACNQWRFSHGAPVATQGPYVGT